LPGVVRTRVGYTGGTSKDPTYYSLGDHTETLQIDFDPTVITYEQLLEVFWHTHNPCAQPWSRRYMSTVFYHGESQKHSCCRRGTRKPSARERPSPRRC